MLIKLSQYRFISKNFKIICIIIFFCLAILINNAVWVCAYSSKTNIENIMINQYQEFKNQLSQLTEKIQSQTIEIKLIKERIQDLSKSIKQIYPGYDYNKIANAAIEENKIDEIPDNMFSVYVNEKYIKPHGLNRYEKTLKNIMFPLEENTSFTTTRNSEYGSYRPYSYYGYKHEGIDIYTFYNNSVYACYDGIIWKKYYQEGGGWTTEIKFEYIDNEGVKKWYFARYLHLNEIYVNIGQRINKGEVIANMGTTGNFSTGIHCHFELWEWSVEKQRYVNINPMQNSTWGNKAIRSIM